MSNADVRLIGWVRAVFYVACAGLLVAFGQAAIVFRTKSILEQRVEILESARKDQQKRNAAQDRFNEIVLDRLEQDARINAKPK